MNHHQLLHFILRSAHRPEQCTLHKDSRCHSTYIVYPVSQSRVAFYAHKLSFSSSYEIHKSARHECTLSLLSAEALSMVVGEDVAVWLNAAKPSMPVHMTMVAIAFGIAAPWCTSKHLNRACLRFKCFLVADVVVWNVHSLFFRTFPVLCFVIGRCKMPFATWIHTSDCIYKFNTATAFNYLLPELLLLSFIRMLRVERAPSPDRRRRREYHVLKITVTIIHDDF